jgi:hypothetical protein
MHFNGPSALLPLQAASRQKLTEMRQRLKDGLAKKDAATVGAWWG